MSGMRSVARAAPADTADDLVAGHQQDVGLPSGRGGGTYQ